MYFNYRGETGGSCVAALPAPAKDLYFAEGYTAGGFDTYLLMQNPSAQAVTVNVAYNVDPAYGAPVTRSYNVAAHSRYTVTVDNEPGLSSAAFGMKVHCDSPIVAERAMYFIYGTSASGRVINGGHAAIAATAPANTWYFAEGYTGW